jgi:hypothetical protein
MFRNDLYHRDAAQTRALADHYRTLHHVAFPGFVEDAFFAQLREDVDNLLQRSMRRDFLMECMDNSPRRMHVVNGNTIERLSQWIPAIYTSPVLLDFLSAIVGESVLPLTDDIDRYVINQLRRTSDTFGAHYDDYPLSFVIILESPGREGGGYAEMVPNATSLAQLEDDPIRLPLRAGDAYILKADTTAHRVAPLTVDACRTAINLAYTTPGYVPRMTESAAMLYAEG